MCGHQTCRGGMEEELATILLKTSISNIVGCENGKMGQINAPIY